MSESEGQLQDFSVDQLGGAIVLVLSAVSSLLLVLWQSKCLCKVNLCYIFQCERRPPTEEEMKGLKEQAMNLKEKKDKKKKESLIPPKKKEKEPEPEPEPEPVFEDANDVENPTL